jgi:hypothetical protein
MTGPCWDAGARLRREHSGGPGNTLESRERTEVGGVLYSNDVISGPFEYTDGCPTAPNRPGLGVEFDPGQVETYWTGQTLAGLANRGDTCGLRNAGAAERPGRKETGEKRDRGEKRPGRKLRCQ